ncbi:MAG: bifunctional demethylmenaquinone methyltransferase/2-methoxy-6-polyprenyl-1,4-benzoquinol methylase UbiE [Armatimonadota bacterium]|nr:bifunctional demethylmenaquinone methyltransferase/2-methoxy-6-polyprenyl-1,4-benzoquinol methylase UbiE [Armatimonadota bacterium]
MSRIEQRPLSGEAKDRYVQGLFAAIAPKYDLLNSIISFNRHKAWRRFAVGKALLKEGDAALDVAAGTGDFSIELAKSVGQNGEVVAVDFCAPMAGVGRRKTSAHSNIHWSMGDAMSLPFASNTFDCATIGFALRNVSDAPRAISEMVRVVKPGGRVISLEINRPVSALFKPFWSVYFYGLLPGIAGLFGGKRDAYTYLPASVKRFYTRQELTQIMMDAGLRDVKVYDLTMGVVCAHVGVKI